MGINKIIMMRTRTLISVTLIVVSILIAFFYIKPLYKDIMKVRDKKAQLETALRKTKDIGDRISVLRSKMNNMSTVNLDKIDAILPQDIDNMRYMNMLSSLVESYGLQISNLKIKNLDKKKTSGGVDLSNIAGNKNSSQKITTVGVDFSVTTSYEKFKDLLKAIEKSLVLFNVDSLSFDSVQKEKTTSNSKDTYTYNIKLTTYLKK